MIKMQDIHTLDADFEKLEISLFNKKNVLLGTVRYFDLAQFHKEHNKITRYFMKSLKGKKINIRLPDSPKVSPAKKSYRSGNLFMDYSSSEKL